MHTNVILTNKRRTHAQSDYTNTKLKAGQETEEVYSTPRAHTEKSVNGELRNEQQSLLILSCSFDERIE